MNDLNNIEEQFRQQLQQMDVKTTASTEEMWTKIESQLTPSRKIAWYWVSAGFALLLLGIGIGYYIANQPHIAQLYTGESHSIPQLQKTEQSFGLDSRPKDIIESSKENTTIQSSPNVSTEKNNSSLQNTPKQKIQSFDHSSASTTTQKKPAADIQQQTSPKRGSEEVFEKATYELNAHSDVESSVVSEEKAFSNGEKSIATSNVLLAEETPLINKLNSVGTPFKFEVSQAVLQPHLRKLGDPITYPGFQLGFAYMPQITLLKAVENTRYPVQYGQGVSAFFLKSKDRYYYSFGLEYNQTKYGYRYHNETTGQHTYYNQLLSVYYAQDGTIQRTYGDTTVSSTITTDVAFNNVYKQMGGFIELGKQWTFGRSSFMAGAQANLYYVPQQNARYTTSSDTYTGTIRASQQGMKSTVIVPAINTQWRYQLAPKWNLHAGVRLTILPSYIWNNEQTSTLFRPNLMIGISRTILR